MNSSEPWKIPDIDKIPEMEAPLGQTLKTIFHIKEIKKLWQRLVKIGTPGLEHTIGGLEKNQRDCQITKDPDNHDLMTRLRFENSESCQ